MGREVVNSRTPMSSPAAASRERLVGGPGRRGPGGPARARPQEESARPRPPAARRGGVALLSAKTPRRPPGRSDARREIVPVRRFFPRLQRLLADELTTRDITLVSEVMPETLEISADPGLLDQALINLVRNAME